VRPVLPAVALFGLAVSGNVISTLRPFSGACVRESMICIRISVVRSGGFAGAFGMDIVTKTAATIAFRECFKVNISCEKPIMAIPPSPEKRGGHNKSMQHLLKVFFYEAAGLISFAGINSNKSKPCLGPD
jgi:hypothetical protein